MDEGAAGASDALFDGRSEEEMVSLFAKMLDEEPVQSLRRVVEAVKIAFCRRTAPRSRRSAGLFVEAGGDEAEFVPAADAQELRLKRPVQEYRRRRDEFIASLDAEKEANLKIKLQIIEELKELVNSDETLNHTVHQVPRIAAALEGDGLVPQQNVKDLWETYNLHVENFYNFIKINKELRDLDLKKNYEQKLALCEAAEALVLEPSIVEAFHKLQKLHDEWRETALSPMSSKRRFGSVSRSASEPYKQAASGLLREHQGRADEKSRTESGTLRSRPKSLPSSSTPRARSGTGPATVCWRSRRCGRRSASRRRRTIPVSTSGSVRRATGFFEAKRRFYADVKTEMEHNLQLKNELCEAAGSVADERGVEEDDR